MSVEDSLEKAVAFLRPILIRKKPGAIWPA
jgi:hypothetical protein